MASVLEARENEGGTTEGGYFLSDSARISGSRP